MSVKEVILIGIASLIVAITLAVLASKETRMDHWKLRLVEGAVSFLLASMLVLAVVLLAGCAGMTLQPDFAGMSEKQIKALAADKNNGVWCGSIGAYGKGVYVSNDLATGAAAKNSRTLIVDGSTCNVTITENPPAGKP